MSDSQKPFFQEKETSYELERDFSITFKYETYHYPEGDIKYSLIMTLPIPQMPGEVIHGQHEYEGFEELIEHVFQDLKDYVDDPHNYCANILRNGPDGARKLKQIQIDLKKEETNVKWTQHRLSEAQKRVNNMQDEIKRIEGNNNAK